MIHLRFTLSLNFDELIVRKRKKEMFNIKSVYLIEPDEDNCSVLVQVLILSLLKSCSRKR